MLTIRKSEMNDLPCLEAIFKSARRRMAKQGNPTQWGDNRPDMRLVKDDITRGNSYVILDDGRIAATFAFIIGKEPTYDHIDGAWLNDEPYGTIHRIASDGSIKGVFACALKEAEKAGVDIRIDTHRDNKVMLELISRHGFRRCGIIIVDDGTERIAFQKIATDL